MAAVTDEDLRANVELDAAIVEAVRTLNYGAVLAAEGQTTVSLDAAGRMQRVAPTAR